MNTTESLKLSNQLCFPIYSVSRLLTKAYKPYLDKIGITYPQYLVLLVLWEQDCISVNTISEKLLLNTNTLSPLLKRMEKQELIQRNRSKDDERSVIVQLTQKGVELKKQAITIPENLLEVLLTDKVKLPEIVHLKEVLEEWIQVLAHKKEESK
jgi:DNA-binding MarR family transcriptional regulator